MRKVINTNNPSIPLKFFEDDKLFEASRVDGKDMQDMLMALCKDKDFLITYVGEEIAAVTSFSQDTIITEAHTHVKKEFLKQSEEILHSHIQWFKDNGHKGLCTICSEHNRAVRNFLIKRLGFIILWSDAPKGLLRDCKPLTIYSLYKDLS